MTPAAAVLWDLLTGAGGSLALSLIVTLALGLAALALLFLGSAVVTLERFARVVRRPLTVVAFGIFWSLLVGVGSMGFSDPDATAGMGRLEHWVRASLGSALAVGVCVLLVWGLLRNVSPLRVATASLVLLGVGLAIVLGASGRFEYAAAPTAVAGGLALVALLRRHRRGNDSPTGDVERLLWVLTGSLSVGLVVSVVSVVWFGVGGQQQTVALSGALLLASVSGLILFGLVPLAAAGLIDARKSVEWFIAVRYLTAKRRQTFISIVTGICVVGIAAGVWLIVVVMSVMNGFESVWRDEIIGNRAHLTVHIGFGPFEDYERVLEVIEAVPDVVAASPYLDAEGMVRGTAGEVMAVRVHGIDPERVIRVTDLQNDLVSGSEGALAGLGKQAQGDPPGIIVGNQLANTLGVAVGEDLTLISPFGGPQTPMGPAPRLKRFRLVGIFETSFFQYDEVYTYVSLPAAQDFKRAENVVDGIEVRTVDFYRSQAVGRAIQAALGFPFYTRDWKELFPVFFQALKSERIMMFVLLTMIMVVAAFSIVSTLVMMIMEKESDIAILKAMGAQDETIERIFAIEGTLIGMVGTVIGVVAAISVTARIVWIQQQIEAFTGIDTLPASVYQISTLPAEVDISHIVVAVTIAMILSMGATLLPSRQGSRLDPVEALRHE